MQRTAVVSSGERRISESEKKKVKSLHKTCEIIFVLSTRRISHLNRFNVSDELENKFTHNIAILSAENGKFRNKKYLEILRNFGTFEISQHNVAASR